MRPDSFEESLRNSLDGFEPGGAAEAWNAIESRVLANNESYLSQKRKLNYSKAALAMVGIGLAIAAWWVNPFSDSSSPSDIAQATTPVVTPPESKQEAMAVVQDEPKSEDAEVESPSKEVRSIPTAATETPAKQSTKAVAKPATDDHIQKPVVSSPVWQISTPVLCQGESVDWKISGNRDEELTVLVNNRKLNSKEKQFTFKKAGNYEIALAKKNKKDWQVIDTKKVVVHPRGGAEFSYDKQKDYQAPIVAFNSLSTSESTKWYIDDYLVSESPETSHLFRNKGRYSVKLVTENENGCKDSSVQTIRILRAYNLMASSVFNPDQEKWMPIGLKGNKNIFELQILNPNGEIIFKSNDAKKEWDGTDVNAVKQKAPNGEMYLWVAKVTDSKGMVMEYGGSILVSYYSED